MVLIYQRNDTRLRIIFQSVRLRIIFKAGVLMAKVFHITILKELSTKLMMADSFARELHLAVSRHR